MFADFCNEDPVTRNCRNGEAKWFFNRNLTRCGTFVWCNNEHENRFDTAEECARVCPHDIEEDEEAEDSRENSRRKPNRYNRYRNRNY